MTSKSSSKPRKDLPSQVPHVPHPSSDISHATSDIRHPTSDIERRPTSDIRDPTSDVWKRLHGKFIVLDGVDGAGKGAQLSLLRAGLEANHVEYVACRDPGGTEIGERIRHVVLGYDLTGMDKRCETLLFMASRAQLAAEVIRPALQAGKMCLCDRYVSATCAYQGAAGFDPKEVVALARHAIDDVWPDLTIVVDLCTEEGRERTGRGKRGHGQEGQQVLFHDATCDSMEARPLSFHRKVQKLFLELPSFYPAPVAIVDGSGTVEEVQMRVMEAIERADL